MNIKTNYILTNFNKGPCFVAEGFREEMSGFFFISFLFSTVT